jgi:hypothetical protein
MIYSDITFVFVCTAVLTAIGRWKVVTPVKGHEIQQWLIYRKKSTWYNRQYICIIINRNYYLGVIAVGICVLVSPRQFWIGICQRVQRLGFGQEPFGLYVVVGNRRIWRCHVHTVKFLHPLLHWSHVYDLCSRGKSIN